MSPSRTHSERSVPSVRSSVSTDHGFFHSAGVASSTVTEDDRAMLAALAERVERMDALLEEFLPLIRAYLDPEQAGPRGYFMRKRLAQTNGRQT